MLLAHGAILPGDHDSWVPPSCRFPYLSPADLGASPSLGRGGGDRGLAPPGCGEQVAAAFGPGRRG